MRTRAGILATALALALTACTGDTGGDADAERTPSAPLTEITVDCEEFADTAQKISDAQAALYAEAGSAAPGGTDAIDTLVAELDALKEGAPADVQAALTDMVQAFRDAEEILANPTPEKQAELGELAPKLSEDGQKITAYITSRCE